MSYIINKIFDNVKKYGLIKFFKRAFIKVSHIILESINNIIFRKKYNRELDIILENFKDKKIFVLFPFFDFNMPNFQRFQQLAIAFGKREDSIFFYCTPNNIYDHIYGFKKYSNISKNLYLTNQYELICSKSDIIRNIIFVSTDTKYLISDVEDSLKRGDNVIYDFVDDIHSDIVGRNCNNLIEKHNFMISNKDILILATSQILYKSICNIHENTCLVTNGVCIEDFGILKNTEKKLKNIDKVEEFIKDHKITLCYYGALAKWFDYDLLKFIAQDKNIGILLIGVDYDGSLKKSNVNNYNNILYIGAVEYKNLKYYISNIDILTIPFLKNSITDATSPVKLFEYMAIKKPIITTNLEECKKYTSVNIAYSNEEFVNLIYKLANLSESEREELLAKEFAEAKLNSWNEKVKIIIDAL